MSKQELFARIRRDSWQRQMSIRALSRKYGVHRRLVREALSSPVPTPRRRTVRTSPRMEPYKKTVDAWLRADLEAPRKHRFQRGVHRLEPDLHRPTALRSDGGPTHVQRHHHRDRNRVLPPGPHQGAEERRREAHRHDATE